MQIKNYRFKLLLIFIVLVLLRGNDFAFENFYSPTASRFKIGVITDEWHDGFRDRIVPVKIYYPHNDKYNPIIIFSHGLGGSRDNYGYLGTYWAARGYVVVHLQHKGSDSTLIETKEVLQTLRNMKNAVLDYSNYSNRPLDVKFALDELTRRSKGAFENIYKHMDFNNIGIAGHSFGAYTVLSIAGQAVGRGDAITYYGPDKRIKAGIAMSSDPAPVENIDTAYNKITIPIFHMTGTKDELKTGSLKDDALIGKTKAEERRLAFDYTHNAPAYLLIFKEGDHRLFSGLKRKRENEHDEEYRNIICAASTAFWDSILMQNQEAKMWFTGEELLKLLNGAGTFEQKP
jgi:predicted dienelactone hydrolase